MGWFSFFFVISGFCGLLYEIVWLRLSMAAFGVTTALVSIVLSIFMAGLGVGALVGGRLAARTRRGRAALRLRYYAATELFIGVSALAVPGELAIARHLLAGLALSSSLTGARAYRWRSSHAAELGGAFWSLMGLAALVPLVTAHPSLLAFPGARWVRLIGGVAPASFLFGYVTPMLIDRWAGDDPERAGRGYAANILGCIVGPLLASFLALPLLGERRALFLLALPWLLLPWLHVGARATAGPRATVAPSIARALPLAALAVAVPALVQGKGFEDQFPQAIVLRDSTATVVAANDHGRLRLIVNGQGMTYLTPITKLMAHLPLASLDHPPARGLVICFGMGTTFRSMLSWGITTTVAELVPSVPRTVGFFHADGARLLESPLARVVIDDGRRFLERTQDSFDVITIDPPPPIQAAGSSLLYSTEFYAAASKRLAPGGILAQWLPEGDPLVQRAVAGALRASFRYVRAFGALDGGPGRHFLASDHAIAPRSAADLLRRMPLAAVGDLVEWGPAATPERQLALTLDREEPAVAVTPAIAAPLTDDHPVNEYFVLRRLRAHHR